jgi:hypothetical protein
MNQHRENPEVTRPYVLASKGWRAQAVAIIAKEGYQDPEHQVVHIDTLVMAF